MDTDCEAPEGRGVSIESPCKPQGDCYLNVICQRCGLCIGHCVCPPVELRGTEEALKQRKTRVQKQAKAAERRKYGAR